MRAHKSKVPLKVFSNFININERRMIGENASDQSNQDG